MSANDRPTPIISGPKLTDQQRQRIRAAGGELLLDDAANRLDEAARLAGRVQIWFGTGLNARILESAPELKLLQTASVGAEYQLFPELKSSKVAMTNIRSRHNSVCDHALALMLAIARCLPKAAMQQRRGEWKRIMEDEVIRLNGSRALIIGTGQLGSGIALRAAAFGVTAIGCSRTGEARPSFSRVYQSGELQAIAGDADWIVNAIPFTPETKGLVSKDVIEGMNPGAVFINVGRGKTVDQDALRVALQSGKLRAAGLDVFVDEPLPADDPLWQLPNVVITPHAAGVMADGDPTALGVDALMENLARYRSGRPLLQPIDKGKGY